MQQSLDSLASCILARVHTLINDLPEPDMTMVQRCIADTVTCIMHTLTVHQVQLHYDLLKASGALQHMPGMDRIAALQAYLHDHIELQLAKWYA